MSHVSPQCVSVVSYARRRAFSAFEDMGAVTERTCLLFYTAGLFDWSFCELVFSVNENTARTNRHGAIIPIWNDLNACSVISVCHSWVSRPWIWRTDLSSGLWRRVVLSYLPPFPFPRPYMCINSTSQGYRIASGTAVTSQCYAAFFYVVAWNNNER